LARELFYFEEKIKFISFPERRAAGLVKWLVRCGPK
jgi:hypothetical protein